MSKYMPYYKVILWGIVVLWAIITVTVLALGVAEANDTAPSFEIKEAHAFRHVVETSDFLLLARMDLPINGTLGDCTPSYTSNLASDATGGTDTATADSADAFDDILADNGELLVFIADSNGSESILVASINTTTDVLTFQTNLTNSYTTAAGASITVDQDTRKGDGDWDCYTRSDAFAELINTSAVTEELRHVTRIGPGITGFYMSAADFTASGITWGDGSTVELYPSPTVFDPVSAASSTFTWHATADEDATDIAIADELRAMMRDIESENPLLYTLGDLIANNLITNAGAQLIAEAFPALLVVSDALFSTQAEIVQLTFAPPGVQILTADAAAAQADVAVTDGSVFEQGMTVVLSDTTPDSEIAEVLSVSSNTVTMTANLTNTYTTAAGAQISYLLSDIRTEQQSADDVIQGRIDVLSTYWGFQGGVLAAGFVIVLALIGGVFLFSKKAGAFLAVAFLPFVIIVASEAAWIPYAFAGLVAFIPMAIAGLYFYRRFSI